MKFSFSWLKDYLDTSESCQEICDKLNKIGLEVEDVNNPADHIKGFLTAKIISTRPHPNADRLQICQVNAGKGFENIQVVCGAPNARANLHVIFAPPGTYIPAADMVIKAGEIRGEKSGGMMCSLREIGLGEEHDGIAELPDDAPIGEDYARYAQLDDPVIDIAITPNRGDALSILGIARDLAAAGCGHLKPFQDISVNRQKEAGRQWIGHHKGGIHVSGCEITNIKNKKSPSWLKERLQSIGISSQNALVDITNYVMFSIGAPLHVYDLDKIEGDMHVTSVKPQKFKALNGQDYQIEESDIIITDEKKALSIAGIIGGEETKVTLETKNIFLEAGLFDPISIAKTGRRLDVQSDARYRFERGIDQAIIIRALNMATSLIIDICGGCASTIIESGKEPSWQRQATLRFNRVTQLAGINITSENIINMLSDLGFKKISSDDKQITVSIPSWRNDIGSPLNKLDQAASLDKQKAEIAAKNVDSAEVEAELVEEIIRLYGFDDVPVTSLPVINGLHAPAQTPAQVKETYLRHFIAGRGFMECIGFSFVHSKEAALFDNIVDSEHLLNPVTSELDQLRPTPLITLLKTLSYNLAHGLGQNGDANFFEIGPAFSNFHGENILVGLRGGVTERYPGIKARSYGWRDVKADLVATLMALGVDVTSLQTTKQTPDYFHPGRSGILSQGPKRVLGRFGELHPKITKYFNITGPVSIFEIFPNLISLKKKAPRPLILSSLQPVHRDFSFVVDDTINIADLIKSIRMASKKFPEKDMLKDIKLFDIFEGEPLEKGKRAIGLELIVQPYKESLTDKILEEISKLVIETVTKNTGALLRV